MSSLFTELEDPYLNPKTQLVKADAIKNAIILLYNLGKQELKKSVVETNSWS
ncbi:22890_t:CDS:2, partial [Racocetra persica]